MKRFIESKFHTIVPHWTIDPALNRALELAVADGICKVELKNKYRLARKGIEFALKLETDKDLLCKEKNFLLAVGKNIISDSVVEKIATKKMIYVKD